MLLCARVLVRVVASDKAAGGRAEDAMMAGIVTCHASRNGSLEAAFGRCRCNHYAREPEQQGRQNRESLHGITSCVVYTIVQEIHRTSDCSEAVAACERARCGGIDIANASDSSIVKKIRA
jgi:hypothetical protein